MASSPELPDHTRPGQRLPFAWQLPAIPEELNYQAECAGLRADATLLFMKHGINTAEAGGWAVFNSYLPSEQTGGQYDSGPTEVLVLLSNQGGPVDMHEAMPAALQVMAHKVIYEPNGHIHTSRSFTLNGDNTCEYTADMTAFDYSAIPKAEAQLPAFYIDAAGKMRVREFDKSLGKACPYGFQNLFVRKGGKLARGEEMIGMVKDLTPVAAIPH